MRVQHLVSNTTAPNSGYFHPLFGGQEADLQHHAVKLASGWVLHLAPNSERDSALSIQARQGAGGVDGWVCLEEVEWSSCVVLADLSVL